MLSAKFQVGDWVTFLHTPSHKDHIGRVVRIDRVPWERSKWTGWRYKTVPGTRVVYVVECECGKSLRKGSSHLRKSEQLPLALGTY